MINIFLSASVPLPDRNRIYFDTADVFLIREAVRALIEVVLPVGTITFGGHPAITPLISLYVKSAKLDRERVTLFQSRWFEGVMPQENHEFIDVRYVPKVNNDLSESIAEMRNKMLGSRRFDAAVLIGGMEGIKDEARLFSELHRNAKILPVPAAGAAGRMVYDQGSYPEDIANEISFASMFRRHLLPAPLQ